MSEPLVLVDASIWIRYFRGHPADPQCALLISLIQQQRPVTNWLIRLEVLSGTLDEETYRIRDADFAELRQLELTDTVYQSASALRWQLQRRGVTIPVVDTVIAACAIQYDCALLHDDQHFRLIARHAPLRLHPAKTV